jgi:tetratricopeptide (TPR) repeat protein
MRTPTPRVAASLAILSLLVGCAPTDSRESALPIRTVQDASGTSLGSIAIPVTCADGASDPFDRGVALLHNMTYTEAESEFRVALTHDPNCVLAYWGMAMSYVHPLWPDVPTDEALDQGASLLAEARQQRPLTEREEAYVSTLEGYYRDGKQRTEAARLADFSEGWDRAHAQDPDDLEAQLFRSLALTAVADTKASRVSAQSEAGALAEGVLERIPDHTGALHYIIHAYDLPVLADRAAAAAGTYGEVAPDNPHALHMTSHIFTRVGAWEESIRYNERAAAAALKAPIGGSVSFHYLHAADYLVYALLQRVDDDGARRVWGDMESLDGPIFDNAAASYAFAAVPARLALERRDWEEAGSLRVRWPSTLDWDQYPHVVAITEFARGLGAARSGRPGAAEAAARRLDELRDEAANVPEPYDWGIQVDIQALGVRAWAAFESGSASEGLAMMRRAYELESTTQKNPVTPGEVLPAAELLGDMLLDSEQYDEAIEAYESSLARAPNRVNSLLGAGRAAEMSGDLEAARAYYTRLLAGVIDAPAHEGVNHAQSFVDGSAGTR